MKRSREILERLPLFPLTGVFLFPGVVTPLHIFERRYVDMTEDALEGDGLIAVGTPDRETAPLEEGKPAIRRIAGVGEISKYERLPDGRYNIWLAAVG
ncbi:MAG: Lon protease-like protein, partial [Flavobacteriales bacterium]